MKRIFKWEKKVRKIFYARPLERATAAPLLQYDGVNFINTSSAINAKSMPVCALKGHSLSHDSFYLKLWFSRSMAI